MLKQRNRAGNDLSQLKSGIRNSIWQFKSISRANGFKQANIELESLDNEFDSDSPDFSSKSLPDWLEAKKIAENYATLWLIKRELALSNGDSLAESARAANRDTLYRLELIAATESSKAFNEGRDEATSRYSGKYSDSLVKVWDATLDRNTCRTCESSDGETVPISQNFSLGEPGTVHPNCRCTYSINSEFETYSSNIAA